MKRENLKKTYLTALKEKQAEIEKEIRQLSSEEKRDEANFAKAKKNICEIFATLFDASCKKTDAEGADCLAGLHETYLAYFEKIPANWKSSLAAAREEEDWAKIVVEEGKLSTAEELRLLFLRCVEAVERGGAE